MNNHLSVYFHDTIAGILEQAEDGQLFFSYNKEYLSKNLPAISISMPLQERPFEDKITSPFFSNLLPDEKARKKLAKKLGLSIENTYKLLELIGGDCAGALSLLPENETFSKVNKQKPQALPEEQLANILENLTNNPLLTGVDGLRLSLAGAQDKLAISLINKTIALPTDGTPTTHILKPMINRFEGIVENELFCMKLAKRMGLDTPTVSKGRAGDIDYLLIERYDRTQNKDGQIIRRHQEDFCQALSVPPKLKYEKEGGPGIHQCQKLIRDYSTTPAADLLNFQQMLIFHYLIGNADAHAKNYSFLYKDSKPYLAPAYDIVCTQIYSGLDNEMAMKIGNRSKPDTIELEHWFSLVPPTKTAQQMLQETLLEMANDIIPHSDQLIDKLKSENIKHPILQTIRKVIHTRSRSINEKININ